MKKKRPDNPQSVATSAEEATTLDDISKRLARLRSPCSDRPVPPPQLLMVSPNADSETLLCHTSENLSSLNSMAVYLACTLEGPHRKVALAIQQLAELCELLVNGALDKRDLP